MVEEKNMNNKNEKIKREIWSIISTIIKSIIVLLLLGVIMFFVSTIGATIYHKNSTDFISYGFWNYHKYLNNFYGIIGMIIYILTNYFAFLSYNHIISKFKNNKMIISKILFLLFNIFINLLMLLFYSGIFGDFSFKNEFLNFFNILITKYGTITFPTIFLIIYIVKAYKLKK